MVRAWLNLELIFGCRNTQNRFAGLEQSSILRFSVIFRDDFPPIWYPFGKFGRIVHFYKNVSVLTYTWDLRELIILLKGTTLLISKASFCPSRCFCSSTIEQFLENILFLKLFFLRYA